MFLDLRVSGTGLTTLDYANVNEYRKIWLAPSFPDREIWGSCDDRLHLTVQDNSLLPFTETVIIRKKSKSFCPPAPKKNVFFFG